jgi:hypothetical protein
MFYRVSGRLPRRQVHAPHYAMHIDGQTGHVIKLWPTTAQELGIKSSGDPIEGVTGPVKLTPEQYAAKRDRLLELSSRVWSAFAAKRPADEEGIRPLLEEYWALFGETVLPEVAPFYLEAESEFFVWLRSAT